MPLDQFVTFQRGFDLPKTQFSEGKYPVYGSTSIIGYHNEFKVKAPGVITGRSGTLGNFQYAKSDFWPHNTSLWVKDFKGNHPKFAYYLMRCLSFEDLNSGGAVPTLNRNVLKSFKVDVPPIKIQKQIAAILSAYDDLIENNLKRIKLLEEMAQITYEEWFVRMKFPGHETAVFDEESKLPVGWSRSKVGESVFVGRGSSPRPISDQVYFENGDIPWLKIADATASHIYVHKTKLHVNSYGASFSRKLQPGSIVVAASGTLGFPIFLATEACVHDGWLYFDEVPEHMTEYFYFTFFYLKEYFERISYGAAIQNINTGIVKGAPLILPPKELLEAFSKKAGNIFKIILDLQKQNELLTEARDILLPRLMTGMIDIEQVELPEAMLSRLKQQEDKMATAV